MSNATSIAAVTGALCTLFWKIPTLQSALSDLKVTSFPLDLAGPDNGHSVLNVFLYQVTSNGSFRNVNVPRQVSPGDVASPAPFVPPVALDLNYLITAYGRSNDDTLAQVALAEAVSLLADNACLSPYLIQNATVNTAITGIDLFQQAERVRITPKPLTIEEISKLWTIFQTKYRISVSYQASVVLIDGLQPSRAALPVAGRTVGVTPGPTTLPTLTGITSPSGQPGARLGDTLVISGCSLAGSNDNLAILFQSPLLAAPLLTAVVTARSATQVTVQLPSNAAAQTAWPAGPYLVSLRRDDPPPIGGGTPPTRTTNAVPFVLAPTLLTIQPPPAPRTATSVITVTCRPAVRPQQIVSLLVGDAEIHIPPVTAVTSNLTFPVPVGGLPAGTYYVRLRVDGVDSLLVSSTQPPAFDPTQKVTLP